MNKKSITALALASVIGVSTLASPSLPLAPTDAQGYQVHAATIATTANAQQKWVLDRINKIRKAQGLDPVVIDPYMSLAATNHFNYILNDVYTHTEDKSSKYYTGKSVDSRVEKAGFKKSSLYDTVDSFGEIMNLTYGGSYKRTFLTYFTNAFAHRDILMDRTLVAVGINQDMSKGNVIDLGFSSDKNWNKDGSMKEHGAYAYPYNGQKDAERAYLDTEDGTPASDITGTTDLGTAFTFFFPYKYDKSEDDQYYYEKAVPSLYDSHGNAVPVFYDKKRSFYRDSMNFFAKYPLRSGHTYTAKVAYTTESGKKGTYTWKFTVEGKEKYIGKVKARAGKTLAVYNTKGKKVGSINSSKSYYVTKKQNGRYYLTSGNYVKVSDNTLLAIGHVSANSDRKMKVYNSKGKLSHTYNDEKNLYVYKQDENKFYIGNGNYVKIDPVNIGFADYRSGDKDIFYAFKPLQ